MYVIKFEIAIGMIEAKAYSYELVNSRMSIMAVIGPPITELHTAAIPETASTALRLLSKLNMGILKIILPAQTPIKRAGDKIPPNNPKPIHKEVKNILRKSNDIKNNIPLFSVMTFTIVSDPRPIASEKNIATNPQITPGINGLMKNFILELLANLVVNNNDFMNIKAIIAENIPTKNKPGKAENISNAISSNTSTGSTRLIFFAEKLAIMEAIEMLARAFIEKCLMTTS